MSHMERVGVRELRRDASAILRRVAAGETVEVTDRGRPVHVLLTIEDYRQLTRSQSSIVELLAMPEGGDIDFEPARLKGSLYQAADLS